MERKEGNNQFFFKGKREDCEEGGEEWDILEIIIITFSPNFRIIIFDYKIGFQNLVRVQSCKDLGVTFDAKRTFTEHIRIPLVWLDDFLDSLLEQASSFV